MDKLDGTLTCVYSVCCLAFWKCLLQQYLFHILHASLLTKCLILGKYSDNYLVDVETIIVHVCSYFPHMYVRTYNCWIFIRKKMERRLNVRLTVIDESNHRQI